MKGWEILAVVEKTETDIVQAKLSTYVWAGAAKVTVVRSDDAVRRVTGTLQTVKNELSTTKCSPVTVMMLPATPPMGKMSVMTGEAKTSKLNPSET